MFRLRHFFKEIENNMDRMLEIKFNQAREINNLRIMSKIIYRL